MIMEYVIRDQKEKPKEVEVWLEKRPNGTIWFCVGGWIVFKLYSDGHGRLGVDIPEHNKDGLQVDESGRIKLVDNG